MDVDLDSLLRMVAAVFAGGVIGINRDIHGKPTGIRAHALVSLGAAALVIAGNAAHFGGDDPAATSRVIQGIVAGIGFLGAGVILRGGRRVYHLTTAASLWMTTAVGVLCGLGAWAVVAIATVLVLIVLVVGQRLDKWLYGVSGIKDDDRE